MNSEIIIGGLTIFACFEFFVILLMQGAYNEFKSDIIRKLMDSNEDNE